MNTKIRRQSAQGSLLAALAFYFLIAFEFLYMASPFAFYFYSTYRPGLDLLNSVPAVAWLSTFILPHIIVETASPLINAHNILGGALFIIGWLVFLVCAGQVYYHKLTRKAEVTRGFYRYVRHPQYTAFIVCSLGMLLLWPRFLALVMFITMTFVYYFLARREERECEDKFGPSYADYKARTGMFLPPYLPLLDRLPALPRTGWPRLAAILALYAVTLTAALGLGNGIKLWALDSLYAGYTPQAAFVSVTEMRTAKLEQVKQIALSDAQVQAELAAVGPDARFINYILPTTWFVPEVPMHHSDSNRHDMPRPYDQNQYKIIFTQARFPAGQLADGKQILPRAIHKVGIVEVWVDLASKKVEVKSMPEKINYDGIPVPIY